MSSSLLSQAGPSTQPLASSSSHDDPLAASRPGQDIGCAPNSKTPSGDSFLAAHTDEDDGEDERMELSQLQSFADKVQRLPPGNSELGRSKITIPKRGEKDFEPLQETARLQEMMLQRSREALFGALIGVRGGNSKSISHALVTPECPYPRIIRARGHLLDSMGMSIRHTSQITGETRTFTELLPEEALYLLERGSLQLWYGQGPLDICELEQGVGEWSDEEYGVKGAVELGVMEGFGIFIGMDGLTWERYQAYAQLKRLGYTAQRPRRFLPARFTVSTPSISSLDNQDPRLAPFQTWWLSIPQYVGICMTSVWHGMRHAFAPISGRMVYFFRGMANNNDKIGHPSLLSIGRADTYRSIFSKLRLVHSTPTRSMPLRGRPAMSDLASPYQALSINPYIPFWHVWKPATPWSKVRWDKGSDDGLRTMRPEYTVAVIDAREIPLPTIHQLGEVFEQLSDEPKGPVQKLGPQYQRKGLSKPNPRIQNTVGWLQSLARLLGCQKTLSEHPIAGNAMGRLRNGDKALIVAVNDSGNTGWVRFGRTGFAGAAVM